MKSSTWAHIALLIANLIYGVNYTVAKGLMPDVIGPNGFILLRVLGASVLFLSILLFIRKEKIDRKDYLRLIACAATGVAANQLLFFNGLSLTTPINSAIIMTSNPILVLIMAAIFIGESLNRRKIAGIILGASGAIWLISMKGAIRADAPNINLGNSFIFLNAASYAAYLVLVKPLMKKYKPITVITLVFSIGFFIVLPFGFAQFGEVNWSGITTNQWLGLAFVVIGTTFLAYLLNIFAIKNVPASTVSSYIYLQPVFAALVAIPLGADKLSLTKVLAAMLIFVGVYLVSFKPKSQH